jgi:hypothetical protein
MDRNTMNKAIEISKEIDKCQEVLNGYSPESADEEIPTMAEVEIIGIYDCSKHILDKISIKEDELAKAVIKTIRDFYIRRKAELEKKFANL